MHLKGDNKNVFVIDFEFEEKKQKEKPKTKLDLLIECLFDLPSGEYKKSDIMEKSNIDKANFSKYLKHRRIQELKFVKIATRTILISENKDHFIPDQEELLLVGKDDC